MSAMTAPAAAPPVELDLLEALDLLDQRGTHPALGPDMVAALDLVLAQYAALVEAHLDRGARLREQCAALAEAHRRLARVRQLVGESGRYVDTIDVERALDGAR